MTKQITSAPFSASITFANEAAVTDYRNYMTDKTQRNKRFLFFFVQQKVSRGKLSFFYMLFLGNEAQIDRNNYGTMLLCQSKSICQKLARSCKKMKIGQKLLYALFARKLFIYYISKKTAEDKFKVLHNFTLYMAYLEKYNE